MTDEKTRRAFLATKTAVAMHEAAHAVALRYYANVGAFVTMHDWNYGYKLTGWGELTAMGTTTELEDYTMILAGLIVTDKVDHLAPGVVTPKRDWAYVIFTMGMKPDQIRESEEWRVLSEWVDAHWLEITAVAEEILNGRRMFEFPDNGQKGE
jgi:hypothetical protein